MRRPRISVEPGDVPPYAAARRMGLSESDFTGALPELVKRRFPEPDPTTGNFDLQAIDEWRRQRHHPYFRQAAVARTADDVVPQLIAQRFGHG